MTPVILPAWRQIGTEWVKGWAVYFTPTDPDTPPMQWRPTKLRARLLAKRIARRQARDRQWAAEAIRQCGT